MATRLLEISSLSKSFAKGHVILNDISFEMHPGDCTCLVGPNGVGKTTLLRCISGSISADSGAVYLEGRKCTSFHLLIDGDKSIFPRLTAKENIKYFLGLQGIKQDHQILAEINRISEELNFTQYLNIQAQKLSKGSKQKIQLILLVLTKRGVLVLDEPTVGLDTASVQFLVSILEQKKSEGRHILLCSHDIEFCRTVGTHVMNLGYKKKYLQNIHSLENIYSIIVRSPLDLSQLLQNFPNDKYRLINETTIDVVSHHLIGALKYINPNGLLAVNLRGITTDEHQAVYTDI